MSNDHVDDRILDENMEEGQDNDQMHNQMVEMQWQDDEQLPNPTGNSGGGAEQEVRTNNNLSAHNNGERTGLEEKTTS